MELFYQSTHVISKKNLPDQEEKHRKLPQVSDRHPRMLSDIHI